MKIETSSVAFLQTKLQDRHIDFIKRPDVIHQTCLSLNQFGLSTQERGGGLVIVEFGDFTVPVAFVGNEQFFTQVVASPKHKVLAMEPDQWFEEGLCVLDSGWRPDSLSADCVLQGLLVSRKYNLKMRDVSTYEMPSEAKKVTNRFLDLRLEESYRHNWYSWLQMGI